MNKPVIKTDEFSGNIVIDWEYVADRVPRQYGNDFENTILSGAKNGSFAKMGFAPVYRNGAIFLRLIFQKKFFKPKKGESISFLFEDDNLVTFIINSKPKMLDKHIDWGVFEEVFIPLTLSHLEFFCNKLFISWKYIGDDSELVFEKGIASSISLNNLGGLQQSILELFREFEQLLSQHSLYSENEFDSKKESKCFVYLMKDTVNNSFKIGISNNPEYRENTLQSEKPSIELITSKQFHKRSIAEIFEKVLHEYFRSKRIRGEWFSLSNEDLIDVEQILN